MRGAVLLLVLVPVATAAAAEAPLVHATSTCAPAGKPGRVRCRAVFELPLDSKGRRLVFAEVRVVGADPSVKPLRGRLGPLDAEVFDDARATFTYSVAAEKVGEARMTVRLTSVVEGTGGGPTPSVQDVEVPVRVLP